MYSMIVATNANGNTINQYCKDGETLDEAFARLIQRHGLESWDGWMLSAWPREQRQRVVIVDGRMVDDGPYIKQDCHACGDGRHGIAPPSMCKACYRKDI